MRDGICVEIGCDTSLADIPDFLNADVYGTIPPSARVPMNDPSDLPSTGYLTWYCEQRWVFVNDIAPPVMLCDKGQLGPIPTERVCEPPRKSF